MNILLLWGEAMAKGYAAPIWMTYKQAQELGANVRKGEHGSLVVYANTISKTETNSQGEDIERESVSATMVMRGKNSLPNWEPLSFAQSLASRRR